MFTLFIAMANVIFYPVIFLRTVNTLNSDPIVSVLENNLLL